MLSALTFGETLKQLREGAGFTQEELAAKLAVNSRTLRKWERPPANRRQQRPPSRYDTLRLLQLFAGWLSPSTAQRWAEQAGYRLTRKEVAELFPHFAAPSPVQSPILPGFYQTRPAEEAAAVARLQNSALVLWGIGGGGKSTLAARTAELLQNAFSDGVIWLELGQTVQMKALQEQLANSAAIFLGDGDETARAGTLRAALQEKRCLLVLDDVWDAQDLAPLLVTGGMSRALITTRDARIADLYALPRLEIGAMQPDEALGLLRQWRDSTPSQALNALARQAGFLPLALSLLGARLREGDSPETLLRLLRQPIAGALDMDAPQTRRESLTLCFELSYAPLKPQMQRRFAALGVFENRFTPDSAAALLKIDADEARQSLRHLHRLALLNRFEETYQLHPLLRNYARQKLTQSPRQAQRVHAR
ncbi:MAG TPA: helix-turn-helix domain-containing protein, partial [Anaerolineae bacterium]|nr:helix-turn-helix domain-containing protein [Anaerolineae bacterium]